MTGDGQPDRVGQFRVARTTALGEFVAAVQRAARKAPPATATAIQFGRQGKIVSVDGGTPSTVTVRFDPGPNGYDIPGIRYLKGYTPVVGEMVELSARPSNPYIIGALEP